MFLKQTTPPLSSSSSKQSIRGPPRPQSRETENPGPEREDDQDSSQHSPFQPFFTLVEDVHTSEYSHPTVHYIFSDDDPDIVTEATLRSLENEHDQVPNTGKGKTRESESREGSGESSPHKQPLLPPPVPGVKDNYIILDIEPNVIEGQEHAETAGAERMMRSISTSPPANQPQQPLAKYKVTSAHSLTPAWQVLNTDIVPAPTFENQEHPQDGGWMLQIRGTAGFPTPPAVPAEREKGSQRLEEMMDQFAKRMGELRMVMEAGDVFSTEQGQKDQGQEGPSTGNEDDGGSTAEARSQEDPGK